MIRGERWKLIHYPQLDRYQLFDLQHDPWELDDLSNEDRYQDIFRDLQTKLARWQQQVGDPLVER
jgi:choline-sulfatase